MFQCGSTIGDNAVGHIECPTDAIKNYKVQPLEDGCKVLGDHETQVSEEGEAALLSHLIGCKKNPGHMDFIPIDKFTLNHLPESYRDTEWYELIKATSDLTVRVGVKLTSPHRPEFWPGTKVSYPFYNMRGKTNLRTGSGMVTRLLEFTDGVDDSGFPNRKKHTKCWCKKCQYSDTASREWLELYVDTAAHVVFDDIEASQTSLRLFYNREDSPVVSVDQLSIYAIDIDRDLCRLRYVTCDTLLADKMTTLWTYYVDAWEKVWNKYEKIPIMDKLNFVVSHPHGCSKQVSVGHWVDKYKVGELYFYKFTYTTSTCPGSSGAPVYCVGYDDDGDWWLYQQVHCGSLNYKLNFSGTGDIDGVTGV